MCLALWAQDAWGQCTAIRQQRNITFNTNRDCAPVDVTDYTITYFFNTPQNPNDVRIRFEWNDPGNNFDEYGIADAANFSAAGGNTEFTATGTFSYPEDDNCLFEPVALVVVSGVDCETSEQTQLVSSWARDNNFGGVLQVNPDNYNVCFGTAVGPAIFEDGSVFNCNINDEPDNPNRQQRHTQFVYGTNHPANSIRDLVLDDGGTVVLTDNSGALAAPTTVNGITATYFGPVTQIPFPADAPNMTSFPVSAPANDANTVGSSFEITMFNWNVCNPYNGNAASPNYADAVVATALITIVDEPEPNFQTRFQNAAGVIQDIFCLDDQIYFQNLTPGGGLNYAWRFFDDVTGTTEIGNSTANNPTFAYATAGQKLIRLTASDPNANGNCDIIYEDTVTISPDAVATIETYDATFSLIIGTDYCQDAGNTLSFDIGFRDATTGAEPVTEWRWELFDENGVLAESFPAGLGNFERPSTTDFVRTYGTPGEYLVRLTAQNQTTSCETIDEVNINIYPIPDVTFTADSVCEGERVLFSGIADSVNSLNPRVNDDRIEFYDWDFSYDGVSFNQELRRTNDDDFSWFLDGNPVVGEVEPATSVQGTYQVALQVTTAEGLCEGFFTRSVTINPLPAATLISNYVDPICPGDPLIFTDTSVNTGTLNYELIITNLFDGDRDTVSLGPGSTSYSFTNTEPNSIDYTAVLRATNDFGCETSSTPISITVLPSSTSAFTDANYDPLSNNCSPWNSTFLVSAATQTLDADSYTWSISDADGLLAGYPITRNKGDADFNLLDYSISNLTPTNKIYMATLEVTKSGVCVDDAHFVFQINPQPDALFSTEEIDSCEYKQFTFEAQQKGLVSYDWNFDPVPDVLLDQNDIQIARYNRAVFGNADINVDVTLQTTNLANCVSNPGQSTETVEAQLESIIVDFELESDSLELPDTEILIQNLSPSRGTWTYEWDFGDGSTFIGYDPGSHEYTQFGNYVITLTIRDDFCEVSDFRTLVVVPTAPIVDFVADTLQGCQPLTVAFTNLSEFAESGKYVWDFGDGTTSNQDNPTYTYFRGGNFTVRLTGENELGMTSQEVKVFYIDVFNPPVANFAANPQIVFVPDQQVFFSNLSTNATSYQWEFGDGNTSNLQNPAHFYTDEGEYDVSLIATNDLGCVDTLAVRTAVIAKKGGQVRSPNAFTPSPDGPSTSVGSTPGNGGGNPTFNDIFLPQAEGVVDFAMLIYNKWGQLIFKSENQQTGWDGYFDGKLMPADVYVYRLELTYSNGEKVVRLGDVTLVR
ncbi:MAG: PKD domain-containing protein [Cyclobacteriaceae bacterium]|nr:PKD domain-containing protein [Cyclobacteriaceae bacterium HetDA_MAG_MS6]